jgi:hypothetical protein
MDKEAFLAELAKRELGSDLLSGMRGVDGQYLRRRHLRSGGGILAPGQLHGPVRGLLLLDPALRRAHAGSFRALIRARS